MQILRPITMQDLDELYRLATEAEFGMTTLTRDRSVLAHKIEHAEESFARLGRKPADQIYLFVLEDPQTGRISGTTAIEAKVGGFQPFYSFRIETLLMYSEQLGTKKEQRVLHLNPDHSGPTAIGTLFLAPESRRGGMGRFLSIVRFLFMACYKDSFEKKVIAEMRGVNDEQGNSPMWEAVGRNFFEMDFPRADFLSGVDKSFIKELLPPYPIYASLLPPSARNVIGKVHPNTEPALNILYNEGFTFSGYIDIFDGGPLVIAERDNIRSVKGSREAVVASIREQGFEKQDMAIAVTHNGFRAVKDSLIEERDGQVVLSRSAAAVLDVSAGQTVRYVSIRP
ncbi:MAG: arginine N-succinyltransferase [Leptospiraceae bacterium]|nr:arginine N-succinyltransferase [Leptospiraceae bacterium]